MKDRTYDIDEAVRQPVTEYGSELSRGVESRATAAVDVIGAGKSLVKHVHLGNLGAPTSPPL